MKDPLLDAFKMALGAADLTREQAEQLVAKLQEKYKEDIIDGRIMVDELLKQSEENSKRLRAKIQAEVSRTVKEQKLVSEKDLKDVIAHLEQAALLSAKIAKDTGKKTIKAAKQKARSMKKNTTPKKKSAKPAKAKKKRS